LLFGFLVLIFAVAIIQAEEQDDECKTPESCVKFNACCQKSCDQKARAIYRCEPDEQNEGQFKNTVCICTKPINYRQLIPTNCGDKTGDSKCVNSVPCCLEVAKKAEASAQYQCDDSKDDDNEPQCIYSNSPTDRRSVAIAFIFVLAGKFF